MKPSTKAAKKILICLAHPDDESFGWGGTLAYYAKLGVAIHLICATRGEAGSVESEWLAGYASIAELREKELQCAVQILGLSSLIFLDYRDSGMAGSKDNLNQKAFINAPRDKVAEKIVAEIRRLRPEIVMTFDSTGGYHHPDHIAIHEATVRAFHAAGDGKEFPTAGKSFKPSKLYFNARSRKRTRLLVGALRLIGKDPKKLGRNKDIDLTILAEDDDTPSHVTIDYRSVAKLKQMADECHASQLSASGFGAYSIINIFWRLFGARDKYTRAYPETVDSFRARDLFAD